MTVIVLSHLGWNIIYIQGDPDGDTSSYLTDDSNEARF